MLSGRKWKENVEVGMKNRKGEGRTGRGGGEKEEEKEEKVRKPPQATSA
jgi:hypothetical protein